jgi:transcription-repair coupling factor (superfamily II helicase)
LRGAGNLLGGQQSGHMDALGFDLYTQMLERTVAELRGEAVEDETSVSINLGVDVVIPDEYINDMGQRLRTYKRVSSARDEETLANIREEIRDRYGRMPESVEQLFGYALLRRLAEDVGVLSIDRTADGVALKFSEKARVSPEKLRAFVSEQEGRVFTPTGILRMNLNEDEQDHVIDAVRGVLLELKSEDGQ